MKYWANAEYRAGVEPADLERRAKQMVATLGSEYSREQMREFLANTGIDD